MWEFCQGGGTHGVLGQPLRCEEDVSPPGHKLRGGGGECLSSTPTHVEHGICYIHTWVMYTVVLEYISVFTCAYT